MEIRFVQGRHFAVPMACGARTVQRKRHWAIRQHRKFAVQQRESGAFFDPGGQDTDAFEPVLGAPPDVVSTRAAGSDAQTGATPYATVISSTASDCTLYRTFCFFVVEELGPPVRSILTKPDGDCFDDPLASYRRYAETAIEQDSVRSSHPVLRWQTVHGDRRLLQECGKVSRDGGIAGVRQTEFAQRG